MKRSSTIHLIPLILTLIGLSLSIHPKLSENPGFEKRFSTALQLWDDFNIYFNSTYMISLKNGNTSFNAQQSLTLDGIIKDVAFMKGQQYVVVISNNSTFQVVKMDPTSHDITLKNTFNDLYGPFAVPVAVTSLEGTSIFFMSFSDKKIVKFDIESIEANPSTMIPRFKIEYLVADVIERMVITDINMDFLFGITGDSVIATSISGLALSYIKYQPFQAPHDPHLLTSLNDFPYLVVSQYNTNKVESLKVGQDYSFQIVSGVELTGFTRIDSMLFIQGIKLIIVAGNRRGCYAYQLDNLFQIDNGSVVSINIWFSAHIQKFKCLDYSITLNDYIVKLVINRFNGQYTALYGFNLSSVIGTHSKTDVNCLYQIGSHFCTKCKPSYKLFYDQGTSKCSSTNLENHFSISQTSLLVKNIDYYIYQQVCLTTVPLCVVCDISNKAICSSCQEGYQIIGGKCLVVCGADEIRKDDGGCLKCPNNCQTCDWRTNTCLTCREGNYYLSLDKESCVSECSQGSYESDNTCLKCPDKCESCLKDGDSNTGIPACLTCKAGFELNSENKCLKERKRLKIVDKYFSKVK